MNFLDILGLDALINILKQKLDLGNLGSKATLNNSINSRQQHLLEIDYQKDLAFDTKQLITNK